VAACTSGQIGFLGPLTGPVAFLGKEQGNWAKYSLDRFNAANRQGAQEQTFQNRLAQKQGIAGVYGAQAGQKNADADYTQRRFAGLGEGLDAAGKVIPGMPEGLF